MRSHTVGNIYKKPPAQNPPIYADRQFWKLLGEFVLTFVACTGIFVLMGALAVFL